MKKYLLILLWLPLFGQVPNTNTFSFLDVKNEIESNGGATTNSLTAAFANANASGFDPAYEGSKNSLLNFRNYTHLSGFRPSGETFNYSANETSGQLIFFKPDGTKMYVGGTASDDIFAYTLSTAWDVTTASYSGENYAVTGGALNPYSIYFKSDGLKMYIAGQFVTPSRIRQYTLSTAWDISTATYDSAFISTDTQDADIRGVYFSSDGTKCYAMGNTADIVYQYTLGTAWDLSTSSYSSLSKDVSDQSSVSSGISFKSDGTKMYVTNAFDSRVYQYTLSTAWNVSTATYDSLEYFFGSSMNDIYIKSDGEHFFFVTTEEVREYITDFPWSIED